MKFQRKRTLHLTFVLICVFYFIFNSEGNAIIKENGANLTNGENSYEFEEKSIEDDDTNTSSNIEQLDSCENEISGECTKPNSNPSPSPTPININQLVRPTQRNLTKEEKEAKFLLDETRIKLEASKLDLYKLKSRLVLQFLETNLPGLESYQTNLTSLLSSQKLYLYDEKENELENTVNDFENRLVKNILDATRYSAAIQNTEKNFHRLQYTLSSILASQFPNATDIRSILGIVDPTYQEIEEFLKDILHSNSNQIGQDAGLTIQKLFEKKSQNILPARAKEIADFISNLEHSDNRRFSCSYLMRELRRDYRILSTEERKTLMFHMVKDVYPFPEFQEFQESLPPTIKLLFGNELLQIKVSSEQENSYNDKYLYIDENNTLQTKTFSSNPGSDFELYKIWKLVPIEDGKYYLIFHIPSSQFIVIGTNSAGILSFELKQFQGDINILKSTITAARFEPNFVSNFGMRNTAYHWDIKIVPGEPMRLKIVNRKYNTILAVAIVT